MESDHVRYLKKRYRECPDAEKKVKFSDIEHDLTATFPSTSWNHRAVSEAVHSAFPESTTQKHGKSRHMYVHGIDVSELDTTSSQLQVEELQSYIKKLEEKIANLKQLQQATVLPETIDTEVQRMLNPSLAAYHGPDTLDHFQAFSINSVIKEVHTHSPELFRLLQLIGKSDRHDNPESRQVSQLKIVSSLAALLKCRSAKVLGVQLLMTFMLIARATSKQVCTIFSCTQVHKWYKDKCFILRLFQF